MVTWTVGKSEKRMDLTCVKTSTLYIKILAIFRHKSEVFLRKFSWWWVVRRCLLLIRYYASSLLLIQLYARFVPQTVASPLQPPLKQPMLVQAKQQLPTPCPDKQKNIIDRFHPSIDLGCAT